ncbi:hypothetical protein Peetri_00218 [Pseudomonas phage vB_PpuM-Peetri]
MQLTQQKVANQQLTDREREYCVNRLKGYRNEIKTLRVWERSDKMKRPTRAASLRAQRAKDIQRAIFYRGILRGTVTPPRANLGQNRFIVPAIPEGYTIKCTRTGEWSWESILAPESHSKSGFDIYSEALKDCVRAQGEEYSVAY